VLLGIVSSLSDRKHDGESTPVEVPVVEHSHFDMDETINTCAHTYSSESEWSKNSGSDDAADGGGDETRTEICGFLLYHVPW